MKSMATIGLACILFIVNMVLLLINYLGGNTNSIILYGILVLFWQAELNHELSK